MELLIDLDLVVDSDFDNVQELTQLQLCKLIEKYTNVIENLKQRSPYSVNEIRYKLASKAIRDDIHHYLEIQFPQEMKKTKNTFVNNERAWPVVKNVREGYIKLITRHIEEAKKHYEEQRTAKAKAHIEASMLLKKSKVICKECGKKISYNNKKRHELIHRTMMPAEK